MEQGQAGAQHNNPLEGGSCTYNFAGHQQVACPHCLQWCSDTISAERCSTENITVGLPKFTRLYPGFRSLEVVPNSGLKKQWVVQPWCTCSFIVHSSNMYRLPFGFVFS